MEVMYGCPYTYVFIAIVSTSIFFVSAQASKSLRSDSFLSHKMVAMIFCVGDDILSSFVDGVALCYCIIIRYIVKHPYFLMQ